MSKCIYEYLKVNIHFLDIRRDFVHLQYTSNKCQIK